MERRERVSGGENDCEEWMKNTVCEGGRRGPTLDDFKEDGDGFATCGLIN